MLFRVKGSVQVAVGVLLGHSLPLSRLRPLETLGLASGEQAVCVGVVQQELDGGLDVLDKVRWLSRRRCRQVLVGQDGARDTYQAEVTL